MRIGDALASRKAETGDHRVAEAVCAAICTRDRPQQLRRALHSLMNQIMKPAEILVVDNAPSGDAACALVREEFPCVRYIRENAPGLDVARNRALQEASHEIVAFIDDDAVADAEWIRCIHNTFLENPRAGACTGRIDALVLETDAQRMFEANGGLMANGGERLRLPGDAHRRGGLWRYAPTVAWASSLGSGCNLAVRRSLALQLGGFDEALDRGPELPGGGDNDMVWRILEAGTGVVYEPEARVRHEHRRETSAVFDQIVGHHRALIVFVTKALTHSRGARRLPVLVFLLWRLAKPGVRLLRRTVGRDPLPAVLLLRIWWHCLRGPGAYAAARRTAKPTKVNNRIKRSIPAAYTIIEIDVTQPLPIPFVSEKSSGVAVLLRHKKKPVGFRMEAFPSDRNVTSTDLAQRFHKEFAGNLPGKEPRKKAMMDGGLDRFPSLTIAVCTKDRPESLERCLKSVREQVFAPGGTNSVEILVIDNAPCDERTQRLVGRFPEVRYILELKPGLNFARNRAVQEAKTELLAFLDDDVVVDRFWLDGLKEAWAENPDAAAFTGQVLPYELATPAQILFERRGGFRKGFERIRYGSTLPGSYFYPCKAFIFGTGANMAFRREVLLKLGGFDEALDTGASLPGGGDLDIFYRIIRTGHSLVYEPQYLVFHQHRRETMELRRQYGGWGLSFMTFLVKSYKSDHPNRHKLAGLLCWWFLHQLWQVAKSLAGRHALPSDMIFAELRGGVSGLLGGYSRSVKRIEQLRRQFV